MAAVLIAFTWYSRPSEEQLKAQRDRDSIAAVQHQKALEAEAAAAAAESSSSASTPIDSTSALFAVSQGTEQLITLENELVRITINTHGGMVEEAVIKNHLDQQKQPVRLLSTEDASMTLSLAGKQENIVTRDLYFQVVSSSGPSPFESESGDALNRTDKAITLRLPLASGSLDIDYCLHPNSYMLDMVVTARGINNLFAPSMRTLDLRWTDRARQLEKGFDFEQRYACIRYHEADGSTDYLSETSDKEKDIEASILEKEFEELSLEYQLSNINQAKMFAKYLDENMNQAALDVRAVDYYRDYDPAVKMQKDGTLFVHCDGGEKVPMSAPTVLIPYDVLPAGEPHGLRLR